MLQLLRVTASSFVLGCTLYNNSIFLYRSKCFVPIWVDVELKPSLVYPDRQTRTVVNMNPNIDRTIKVNRPTNQPTNQPTNHNNMIEQKIVCKQAPASNNQRIFVDEFKPVLIRSNAKMKEWLAEGTSAILQPGQAKHTHAPYHGSPRCGHLMAAGEGTRQKDT